MHWQKGFWLIFFPYYPIPSHSFTFLIFLFIPSHPLPLSTSLPLHFKDGQLPSFLNPSYNFPSQPSGFPPFSFIPVSSNISHPLPFLSTFSHPFRSLVIPISSHPLSFPSIPIPYYPIPSHSFPSHIFLLIPSHCIPYIPSCSFPSFLIPSYTFPSQPPGFPPSRSPQYLPIFPIPSDPLSSHPFPSLLYLVIYSHPFPSFTPFSLHSVPSISLHHPCPYCPIRHHPFHHLHPYHPHVPSILSNSFPLFLVTHPFKSFPSPSYISHRSHLLLFLISSRYLMSLSIPSRFFYPFHPFPSHPAAELGIGELWGPAGSSGVECVCCRRERRRHDHLWSIATSIGINITTAWARPLPPTAGNPSQEQTASAEAARTGLSLSVSSAITLWVFF